MTPATEDAQTLNAEPIRGKQSSAFSCHSPSARLYHKSCARRTWTRRSALAAVWAALCGLAGCAGPLSFTNDGIPPGVSKVAGRVLAADNPQMPLANLNVTVLSTPPGRNTIAYRVTTDANGLFEASGVITGKHQANGPLSISNVVVSVDVGKAPYQAQKVSLLLTENQPTQVVLALPPTGFDLAQVGGVSVDTPAVNSNSITTATTFQFTARMLDHNNSPIVSPTTGQFLIPSLVLDDLTVTGIGANGLFQVSGAQIGTSHIMGQVSVPSQTSSLASPRIDLLIQAPITSGVGNTPQITPGIPAPPLPPVAPRSAARP